VDGGLLDQDGGPNGTLMFGFPAPAVPAGFIFDLVTGYDVLGLVLPAGGGALATLGPGIPFADIVNLTNFGIVRPAGAGGVLTVTFEDTFAGPAPPVNAAFAIIALAENAAGLPILAGTDQLVSYQGFVNGVPIAPAIGPFGNPAVAAGGSAQYGVAGAALGAFGGPFAGPAPWILKGVLKVSLGAVNDEFILEDSAEVGIYGNSIPEPATWILLGMGVVGIAAVTRRRPTSGSLP
jgi:hypothetical protein